MASSKCDVILKYILTNRPKKVCSNYKYITLQVGIDLIGPLPVTPRGNKYVVTLVDYFSKWPEASALPDKNATGVAHFIYELFCR